MIRFRTSEGIFRIQVQPTDDFSVALNELANKVPGYSPSNFLFSNDSSFPGHPASNFIGKTIGELSLNHGDLLFVKIGEKGEGNNSTSVTTGQSSTDGNNTKNPGSKDSSESKTAQEIFNSVKQLVVDDKLDKKEGKIRRPRDVKMCRHGENAMCDYCMPLEPFDQGYKEEHNIKHLSFHSYLRKLNIQANMGTSGSSYVAPLNEPYYKVKAKCPSGHPAWPAGICSKCQPSAITLQRQEFRMVDHVEFASSTIINSFIDTWRQTGSQRIGYMYGHYEEYEAVPLGVKAVVEAIYEPPQQNEWDGVALTFPWDDEERGVENVAKFCGLQRVGVIFTDLLDAGGGDGSVVCKRHIDSYFLSSLEIMFAAEMQRRHPNPTKWSISGQFSSKFVTCVISGNSNSEIDIASYQVSTSAEAMTAADLIEPSLNPSVMRVKEATSTRYVPEVFYTRMNEYNRKIQENAKPAFPVEYLLVTLTHGFPEQESPKFLGEPGKFPIENRGYIGQSQDMPAIAKQLGIKRGSGGTNIIPSLSNLSDFHLLCYISGLGVTSEEELKLLCEYGADHKEDLAFVLKGSPGWETLKMIISESI